MSTCQLGFGKTRRGMHKSGDFPMGVTFHIVQPHHGTRFRRQCFERPLQVQGVLPVTAVIAPPCVRRHLVSSAFQCHAATLPVGAHMHKALVHGNLPYPQTHRRLAAECRQTTHHVHESVLEHILGQLRPGKQAPRQRVHRRAKPAIEVRLSPAVTVPGQRYCGRINILMKLAAHTLLRCAETRKGRNWRKKCSDGGRICLYLAPRLPQPGFPARVAELVDARDSKSRSPQRSVGSIPTPGTIHNTAISDTQ